MFAAVKNFHTGHIFVVDDVDGSMSTALRIMRQMRWAHVERHGRKGQRWFTVTMRNPDEWRIGAASVDGLPVKAVFDEV